MIGYLVLLICSIICAIIVDGTIQTLIVLAGTLLLGFLEVNRGSSLNKIRSQKIFLLIYSIYLISACIVSSVFKNGQYFLVFDPTKYISRVSQNQLTWNYISEYLKSCYFELADNNALYNIYIAFIGSIGNIGGTNSILSLTFANSIFGVLAAVVLYRILNKYLSEDKAYKYTIIFVLFSLFHFYSVVIIRDIIIAYLFIVGFEIIDKEYNNKNLLILVILMLLTWGIRLYSGLFYSIFIIYYIYKKILKSKYKLIGLPLFIVLVLCVISLSSVVIQQTIDEVQLYDDFTEENEIEAGGLYSMFYSFPPIIKEIVTLLYSQIAPFPAYLSFAKVSSIPQFYMALFVLIYEIFWYFIFYTLIIALLFKKKYLVLSHFDRLLFWISIIFLLVNTAHPDIRRMMPVYPILYVLYLKIKEYHVSKAWLSHTRILLGIVYFSLIGVYYVMKYF